MATLSLRELVEAQNTKSENNKYKKSLGYTVRPYSSVLANLKKSQRALQRERISVTEANEGESINQMSFDTNGFSNDDHSALWEMELGFYGPTIACETSGGKVSYLIVTPQGYNVAIDDANTKTFPATVDGLGRMTNPQNGDGERHFKVGAIVSDKILEYFNRFYSGGTRQPMKQNHVATLMEGGYLSAKIFFPQGESRVEITVKVLEKRSNTVLGNSIKLDCALLCTKQFKNTNLKIDLSYQEENKQKTDNFLPTEGVRFSHPYQGSNYDAVKGTIEKYTIGDVEEKNPKVTAIAKMMFPSEKPKVHVRFYIDKVYENDKTVNQIINSLNIPSSIFSDSIKKQRVVEKDVDYEGNLDAIIQNVLRKWERVCVKPERDVPDTEHRYISYVYGKSHDVFVRNTEDVSYYRQDERGNNEFQEFKPIFVPKEQDKEQDRRYFDCSSFVSIVFADYNVMRSDLESFRPFTSADFEDGNIAETIKKINRYLDKKYKAIAIEKKSDTNDVKKGDILVKKGHLAIACGNEEVLHLSNEEMGKGKVHGDFTKQPYRYNNFKKIIRIEYNQQNN